ncbi:hypothetical protein VCUG_01711 [Vavraia culicis subsp. floridensis]|uniref:NodB homology domain-containing protein n=1 Tax=Vavraia culicis (isolate floridensis) TaxID=948595 RepID=L2GT13_VAVCU|nr:uncharacterized protein VCUG_01711 [Vavraia culicis subsp. floridensis]ELA46811.1 hypothetical protein VCUG_01711 [Vavraia culicis subsp. floridensis]
MFIFFSLLHATILPDRCAKAGMIALTFDEGPTGYTPAILETLRDEDVKATFHFTIQNVTRGNIAEHMREAVEDGHTVGLRVNPTRNYDEMDAGEIKEDIDQQIRAIQNETETKIRFARAPVDAGETNAEVYNALMEKKIIQSNYTYCLYYEVEDVDAAREYLNKVFNASNPKYDSFIFLLHEEREKDFPILQDIITLGKKNGYKFVTMDECLDGYKPGTAVNSKASASKLKSSSAANDTLIVPLSLLVFLLIGF